MKKHYKYKIGMKLKWIRNLGSNATFIIGIIKDISFDRVSIKWEDKPNALIYNFYSVDCWIDDGGIEILSENCVDDARVCKKIK